MLKYEKVFDLRSDLIDEGIRHTRETAEIWGWANNARREKYFPPIPFCMLKAMDPCIYRNVSYDSLKKMQKKKRQSDFPKKLDFPLGSLCAFYSCGTTKYGMVAAIYTAIKRVLKLDDGTLQVLVREDRPHPGPLLDGAFGFEQPCYRCHRSFSEWRGSGVQLPEGPIRQQLPPLHCVSLKWIRNAVSDEPSGGSSTALLSFGSGVHGSLRKSVHVLLRPPCLPLSRWSHNLPADAHLRQVQHSKWNGRGSRSADDDLQAGPWLCPEWPPIASIGRSQFLGWGCI